MVQDEDGKTPESKSYIWLYTSGAFEKHRIVIYEYQPTRGGYHAAKFLADFMVMYTLMDSFWEWVEKQNPLGESKFSKAVNYALNQKPYMKNYLTDGRCSISNNAAERAVKSYVMERAFYSTVQ